MEYAEISENITNGVWRAILTDGGASTQLSCDGHNVAPTGYRPVPEIFALADKT